MTIQARYAGFWMRLAAYLVDVVILSVAQVVLLLGVFTIAGNDLRAISNASLVSGVATWAYFALFESSPLQATIGKYALGLYVSDVRGDPISFGRASVRYWLKILSSLTLMIGWIIAGLTPRKQALHDVMAGTLVLRKVSVPAPATGLPAVPFDDYWDGTRWVSPAALPGER